MIRLRNSGWRYRRAICPSTPDGLLGLRTTLGGVGNLLRRGEKCAVFTERAILENGSRIGMTVDLG
jgi:hypothetical protein